MSKHDQLLAVVNRLAVHVPDSAEAQAALIEVRGVVASLRPVVAKPLRVCDNCVYLDLRLDMCSYDQCHEDKPRLRPEECRWRMPVGEVAR